MRSTDRIHLLESTDRRLVGRDKCASQPQYPADLAEGFYERIYVVENCPTYHRVEGINLFERRNRPLFDPEFHAYDTPENIRRTRSADIGRIDLAEQDVVAGLSKRCSNQAPAAPEVHDSRPRRNPTKV